MSEPKVKPTDKEKEIFAILYDFFRSLKLTIFILILLAILSIIGTLIAQNAAPEDYIHRYGASLYEVLDFFSLFDMYHSWWFSAILLLLVINLIACSLQRFPGVWNQIFRGAGSQGLEESMLKTLPYVEKVRLSNPAQVNIEEVAGNSLKKTFKQQERIETDSTLTLFAEKGRFSRLGVYITHLSLLIILIGGIMGSLFGFKGFVNILEGETADRFFIRGKNANLPKALPFSVRCDDFNVTFYDLKDRKEERYVKEYTSLLTIIENGKEVLKKTVEVNHPLHYKGLAFYQSSYGALQRITLGIQKKNKKEKTLLEAEEGDTIEVPEMNALLRVLTYAPQVHTFGEGVQVALLRPNQEPRVFWVIKGLAKMEQQSGEEFAISFEAKTSREYTGLQVTRDPGVWVVWVGCGLMIFGFIVSFFFSHQKVWVRIPKGPAKGPAKASSGELVLAGSTNKNRVGFEKIFQQLATELRSTEKGK
jgi:cytochrome c biogenesis protein